jgi:molybdopterin molybdotransferase
MRLFKELLSVDEAKKIFLSKIKSFGETDKDVEKIRISEALSRVAASDVASSVDIPHYDRAAMDGFAVVSEATKGASPSNPVLMKLGTHVDEETCVWVHTGDAMPEGGDAVVKAEDAEVVGEYVEVFRPVRKYENVGRRGEDVKRGDVLIRKGDIMKPAHVAILRSAGIEEVEVFRKPCIFVLPTGDELLPPGEELKPGKVYESNGIMVSSYVTQWGGIAELHPLVGDDADEIAEVIEEAGGDLIITTGGTSVGKRDYMLDVLSKHELLFRGIALRPGKPTLAGIVNEKPVLSLPGFPTACIAVMHILLKPAMEKMLSTKFGVSLKVRLLENVTSKIGFTSFVRVKIDFEAMTALPIATSGSGILSSVTAADGYILIPENVEGFERGERVTAYLF